MESAAKIKRIAIVSPSYPPLGGGGIQASHYNLANALIKRGFTVEVFTYVDSGASLQEQGIHRCGLPRSLKALIRWLLYFYFKLIRDHRIAFLFADSLSGSLGGMFLVAKIRRFKPDIVIVPDQGAPSAFWPSLSCTKTIFISHHNSARLQDEPLFGLHSRRDAELAVRFEQRAVHRADMVLCPSEYMREVFRKTYSFAGQVKVVPNLIDSTSIEGICPASIRDRLGLGKDAPIIYIPSAESPYKGSRFVFEIMRRLAAEYGREIGFYLTGSLNAEQRRLLEFLPDNVRFHAPGNVEYLENIANIKSCTICVSPTLIENFGMAILEAQFCGLPAVSFDVGGNKELLVNGETGYLVPFMDIEGLIDRALHLVSNPASCEAMGMAARERAMSNFSEQRVLERFEEIFKSLFQSK